MRVAARGKTVTALWTNMARTSLLQIKFYWNRDTLIDACIVCGCLSALKRESLLL